jgi:WD40 repeat protein
MPTHGRAVYGLAWHPVDALLASGGEDGVLRCWDTSSGTQSTIFADDRAPITTVVWNRQGDLLISGSKDGMLRWWDSQNKTQRHAQQGHRAWIFASSVSPDDTLLASCGSDGLIQLWDVSHATHRAALHTEQPYEALDITDALGLSEAQKDSLKLLGAVGN